MKKLWQKIKSIFRHKDRNRSQVQIGGNGSTLVQIGNINSSKKSNDSNIHIKVGEIDIEV
jgi:hypothetical protein